MAQTYGYVRVSTREQNEGRQLVAMRDFGVSESGIYIDKVSGKDFQRPAYRRLLKKIKPDDVLVVKSIDRLGRDYGEILEQWRIITKEKQAAIVVIDIPLLDTRQKERDLTGTFIADLVLNILSYVAQQEREFIRQRQAEGIEAAKARGVKFGRPPLERPALFETVLEAWGLGEISAREAGRRLGISKTYEGKAVAATHKGSYKTLETAYHATMKYVEDNAMELVGIFYDYYLNDPSLVPEDELLTKVVIPVK